jgi:hypothetical protein
MGALIPIPGAATPVERILSRFDRAQLEGFIAVAIDLLDIADGDTDVELNGDEADGTGGEDDFIDHHTLVGDWGNAGCPVSDPGGCEHDGREPDYTAGHVPIYGVDQDGRRMSEDQAGATYAAVPINLRRRRKR